jgi:hypothetical protein
MLKRPLHPQFNDAVWEGRKTTTIRDTPWPARPIMLYNWRATPYASPHVDVCEINVTAAYHIRITHTAAGEVEYESCHNFAQKSHLPSLQSTEGFPTQEAMDAWFRPLILKGSFADKYLHIFYRGHRRTDLEIVRQTDKLALEIALLDGCKFSPGFEFHKSSRLRDWKGNLRAAKYWEMSRQAQIRLTKTDPDDAIDNLTT